MATIATKLVCLGAPAQGKTSLIRVAHSGQVPSQIHKKLSNNEENVKVYLLPEEGQVDASAAQLVANNNNNNNNNNSGSSPSGSPTSTTSAGGSSSNNNNSSSSNAKPAVVVFHVWNIPGQNWKAYEHSPSFFRLSEAAIIVVECTMFDASEEELDAASSCGRTPIGVAESMIEAARRHVQNIPCFLCITKCDTLKGYNKGKTVLNPIDTKVKGDNSRLFVNAEKFISEHQLVPQLICTSAVDKNGISKLFSVIYEEYQARKIKAESASPDPVRTVQPVTLRCAHEPEKKQNTCCLSGGGGGGGGSGGDTKSS